jgi:hypothetical protein
MNKDEALQMCLEYIETDAHERKYVRHAIKQALAAPVQEPVDVPKIEWVNTSSDWVVHYLQAKSIFNAEQIGEMMDFAARAANKFYTTPPAAQPAPVQEPAGCQHKRYSVDAREGTGTCHDCGAEGRMQFVVGDINPLKGK